jgi:hypothetical protein
MEKTNRSGGRASYVAARRFADQTHRRGNPRHRFVRQSQPGKGAAIYQAWLDRLVL